MIGYTARDVANLLGVSEVRVRSFVKEGFITPRRGEEGELLFGFQDLVLLRTAKGLFDADVSARRVKEALLQLKSQLPRGLPLTAVHVFAREGDVIVQDGDIEWEPASGQVLFNFDVGALAEQAEPLTLASEKRATEADLEMGPEDWYELGSDLETVSPARARDAYRRALELDPRHVEARMNCGRLLLESSHASAAEAHFAIARSFRPEDATAAFQHGVSLEALGRLNEALEAFERVIDTAPRYRDAYRHLARLHERLGQDKAAIRTYKRYRELFPEP